ncbi:hypothetical protein APHAL10511_007631 [Amanita phalloides]|nr:hypothetical protein APHAL10511_007631 [Amanita phalloides]
MTKDDVHKGFIPKGTMILASGRASGRDADPECRMGRRMMIVDLAFEVRSVLADSFYFFLHSLKPISSVSSTLDIAKAQDENGVEIDITTYFPLELQAF